MVDTLPTFVDALREAAVLEPEQLEAVEHELLPRLGEVRALAKELLTRGWLTAYQANRLLHGHGRDLILEPYILLDRLGEGGMGQVFKARHQKLGRIVALKLLRKEEIKDPRLAERFRREILAVAQLDHKNVVKAHDAGHIGDSFFYVMDYIDGMDLTRLVRGAGPLPVRQACDYIRQAALGLQHAHERGMVHRDIKPSNLLATADGTTVKLLDLGLARMRGPGPDGAELATVTQIGIFVGTPDFVAPEQAVNSRDVDIRADIYSLGCTLYFLLTGEPPFPGDSTMEKLIKHKTEEPIRLETIRPDVPRGVAAIQRKLMAKKPENRYQTPAEVAAALEPFSKMDAENIIQSPVPQRRPRLRKAKAAQALASTVQLVNGEPVAAHGVETPRPSRTQLSSVMAFERMSKPISRRRRDWWRWGIAGGVTVALFTIMVLVLANLVDQPNVPQSAEEAKPPPVVKPAIETKKPPVSVSLSRLDQLDPAKLPEDALEAWRVAGEKPPAELVAVLGQHTWRHWGPVRAVAVDAYEKLVASAGDDGVIRIWELESGRLQAVLREHSGTVWSLDFSNRGEYLASAGSDGQVRVWSTEGWELKKSISGHRGGANTVAFPPAHAAMVVSGGEDGTVRAWSLKDWSSVAVIDAKAGTIWSVAFSASGEQVVAGTEAGVIKTWEIQSRRELDSLETRTKARITGVAFGRDASDIVSADAAGKVSLWARKSRLPRELPGHAGGVSGLATFSSPRPFPFNIVSCGADGEIHLLRPERRVDGILPAFGTKALKGHIDGVAAVAVTASGKTIVSGGLDGTVRVWDAESGQERFKLEGHQGPTQAVAFAADGKSLVSASADHTARLWDIAAQKEFAFRGHLDAVTGVALLGDGKQLATASHDRTLRLWDVVSGREKKSLKGHEQRVLRLAASPDGKLFASGDADGTIIVWDAVTGNQHAKLKKHADKVMSLAFSPDGRTLASAGGDKSIHLWDLQSSRSVKSFEMQARLTAVTYFADGKRLACSTDAGHLAVWDAGSGQKLWHSQLPGPIQGLAVAPDGRHVATANGNGTVAVLRVAGKSAGN